MKQQGSALIILIGVMLMVLLLGAAVVSMRNTSVFTKPEINNSNKAFYLAESGRRFTDFSNADGSGTDGKIYRLSDSDQFQLIIGSDDSSTSTGIIYQNSAFETIREIGGLRRFGLPCWNFDNAAKPGEDICSLNDGTLSGGLLLPVSGRFGFGNALQCNGSGWMETPFKPLAEIGNGKAFSISFWVNPDNITSQQVVLGVSDGAYRFSVGITSITSGGKWFWAYGDKTEPTSISADIGYWQKVTLVYTGKSAGDQMTLYVSKCAIQEFESFNYGTSGSTSSLPTAITNLFVCAEHTSLTPSTTSFPFFGLLDEVKIYDRALDEAIEINPTCGVGCDAVAYYPFNGNTKDKSGPTQSGHGNDGTRSSMDGILPDLTDDRFGCPNKAYLFDATHAQYIHVPANLSLDLKDSGTLAAWIKIRNFKDTSGLIHKGDNADFLDEVYSFQFWTSNSLSLIINGNTDARVISAKDFATDTAWHHVAVTWDTTGSKFYLDGVVNASGSKTDIANISSGGLNIGAQITQNYNASYKNFPFDGKIDEVVIYNRALSADEIAILANADDS